MPYSAAISRNTPTLLLFVIDQSGSMDERMEHGQTKAQFVADVLNKTLYQLVTRCTRADGVRDYFHVGVLGYGGTTVATGFGDELAAQIVHPLSAIERHPLRVDQKMKKVADGAGGVVEQSVKMPVWFDPKNSGGTPMCASMAEAAKILFSWCQSHGDCYPPTMIHVTDGQSTDGSPEAIAEEMKRIATADGGCLLFNLHISTLGEPILFPPAESSLPNDNARMLFRMSSVFPPRLLDAARERGYPVSPDSRFFGYQGGVAEIVDFFDIGTRADNLR
jgi:hypothetical protein